MHRYEYDVLPVGRDATLVASGLWVRLAIASGFYGGYVDFLHVHHCFEDSLGAVSVGVGEGFV